MMLVSSFSAGNNCLKQLIQVISVSCLIAQFFCPHFCRLSAGLHSRDRLYSEGREAELHMLIWYTDTICPRSESNLLWGQSEMRQGCFMFLMPHGPLGRHNMCHKDSTSVILQALRTTFMEVITLTNSFSMEQSITGEAERPISAGTVSATRPPALAVSYHTQFILFHLRWTGIVSWDLNPKAKVELTKATKSRVKSYRPWN